MITCLECKREFKRLNTFHLKFHNLNEKTYLDRYPHAKLYHENYRNLISQKTKEAMRSEDVKNNFSNAIKDRRNLSENLGKYIKSNRTLTDEEYRKSYSVTRNKKISNARRKYWSNNKGKTIEELWGKEKAENLRKLQSESRLGEKNPAFGKVYEKSGGKIGKYKGLMFRGIWELSYWKYLENLGYNIHDESVIAYEALKIPYESSTKRRTYFPDFLNKFSKELVEVKSFYKFSEMSDELFSKKQAAEKWCQENGYVYKILTEKDFPVISYSQAYADKDIVWIKK